jgi:membrane protease YdiL (CAAX protease family)
MISAPAIERRLPRPGRAARLLLALAAAALLRGAVNGDSVPSALLAGTAFGLALIGLAAWGGWRPARTSPRALAIGILGGLVLIGLPRLLGPATPAPIGLRPDPFAAWALVTVLVASAEEIFLRGALLGAIERAAGYPVAVIVTSAAFGLMHVPLYGWAVVPLDAAVGVWLAGLRTASGGVAAPAVAHILADLATWWP